MLTLSVERARARPGAALRREVNVWRDGKGAVCAHLQADGDTRWIEWPGLGLFQFERDGRTVLVWPASTAVVETIHDVFHHRLQPLVLQAMGAQALHASASLSSAGVIAFCGMSGSGKSTLAYALRGCGWPQVADDALVLSVGRDRVMIHPLPFRSELRRSAREHLPQSVEEPSRRPPTPLHLRAVVILQQDSRVPRPDARTIAGPERFQCLLEHAHAFDPEGEAPSLVRDYFAIAATVPVVRLTYRPDFAAIDALLSVVRQIAHDGGIAASPKAR